MQEELIPKFTFVCKFGQDRSPTGADVARRLAAEAGLKLETEYFGAKEVDGITAREKLELADVVFTMDEAQRRTVIDVFRFYPPEDVVCLGIPDDYVRNSAELVSLFEKALPQFIAQMVKKYK